MRTIMTAGAVYIDQCLPKSALVCCLTILALAIVSLGQAGALGVHPQPISLFRGVPWTAITLYAAVRVRDALRPGALLSLPRGTGVNT